jgi:cytochrome c-type biogenesis protein CcmF
VLLLFVGGVGGRPFALVMFSLGAFVVAAVGQELWRGVRARRAMTSDSVPRAFVALIRRNRRRYGGYIVHAGLAVMLVGVAASSSFQHAHDVALMPGQSTTVDGYTVRYVKATADPTPEKISLGAVLDVSKGGKHVTTLRTARGFYPSQDPGFGVVGRFFNGEAESTIGLRAGLTRDIWTVINPDLGPLQKSIDRGNRLFMRAMTAAAGLPAAQARAQISTLLRFRDQAISELAQRLVSHPWPATFLLIVSPMVTWLWLGAIVMAVGGLIALSPVPAFSRRRSRAASAYAARVARELA